MNSTDRLLTETRDMAKELNTGIHMVRSLSIIFQHVPFVLFFSNMIKKVLMMDWRKSIL